MKKLFVLFLAILMALSAFAQAESTGEVVIFEGRASAANPWELVTSVFTTCAGGEFDPELIKEGCCFTVDYTGTAGQIYLALAEWTTGTWAQANAPETCVTNGDVHTATFTYAQCLAQYGSADFTDVDAIGVGSANSEGETTVLRIAWQGAAPSDPLMGTDAVTILRSASQSSAANSQLSYAFTRHVGGDFDAAQINPGSRFYVEHSGAKNGVYLAFSSHSGAKNWVRVNPDETVELDNGRFASWFDYSNFAKNWGTNFARLDQLSVFSAVSSPVKLHRLAYLPGTGAPTDGTDGRWDRPETGIAFIGDSICQNALNLFGDWNKILGRTDCVNYGIGGQTTVNCLARIGEVAAKDYHTVVFLCGINDIGWNYTSEQIVGNWAAMIDAIRAKNPDCQFILLSVLPTTDAFYRGQQDKIVALNEAYKAFADRTEGVTFVDAYSRFTSAPGEYANARLLMDGLHPNAEGYAVIAQMLNPALPAE